MSIDDKIAGDYISRINKALLYIDDHLSENLNLEVVSKVAFFSPFHFHRIFKAVTNETLYNYINRRRLEKAASDLIRTQIPVTEIALNYGFNSSAAFTRSFKRYYGLSPSQFRKRSPDKYSKISKVESKNGEDSLIFESYIDNINNHLKWIKMNSQIEIKDLPTYDVAYVTNIGIDSLGSAFDTLMEWGQPKGLLDNPDLAMATVYHDSFKITSPDQVRMSACMILEEPMKSEGKIGMKTIDGGRTIISRLELAPHEFEQAWSGLFIWMNENGYTKADRDPFEVYYNDYREHPEKKCIVDICIPVE